MSGCLTPITFAIYVLYQWCAESTSFDPIAVRHSCEDPLMSSRPESHHKLRVSRASVTGD